MRDPDYISTVGFSRGWKIEENELPGMGAWLMEIPGAHPLWWHFMVAVISLDPLEGFPEATITVPGATREVMLVALDSRANPDPDDVTTRRILTPGNWTVQIDGSLHSDEHLLETVDLFARALMDRLLPVEPQGIMGAFEALTDAFVSTLDHFRDPNHGAMN